MIYEPQPDRMKRHHRRQATRRADRHFGLIRSRSDWRSISARLFDWMFGAARPSAGRGMVMGAATLVAVLGLGAVMLPVFASIHPPTAAEAVSLPLVLPEPAEALLRGHDEAVSSLESDLYVSGVSDDRWTVVTVRRNENLGAIFERLALPAASVYPVVNFSKESQELSKLYPGEQLAFEIVDGQLLGLQFDLDEGRRYLMRTEDGISGTVLTRNLERRVQYAAVHVKHTLFGSANEADLSDALVMKMVDVFNYDIDFAQDIGEGDSFALVYEEIWRDGEKLRDGDILAASFVNRGKRYEVYRFETKAGGVDFLSREGKSRKRAFIRTPLEFTRISSRFSLGRRHPILGTMRAHRGVDYAAPTGTPIKATGAGKIAFAGWRSGYGNVVEIQHGQRYRTIYGHMSRFNKALKTGSKVEQGQIIGYVGMTGLATGPHLHYEFRVDNQHRDPLSVDLPISDPLSGADRQRFLSTVGPMVGQLATMESTLVAKR